MKKIFAMMAAILLCGTMMVSCHKDDDNNDNNTKQTTKTDMVGTWEGTFQGTTTVNNAAQNYLCNLVFLMQIFEKIARWTR